MSGSGVLFVRCAQSGAAGLPRRLSPSRNDGGGWRRHRNNPVIEHIVILSGQTVSFVSPRA